MASDASASDDAMTEVRLLQVAGDVLAGRTSLPRRRRTRAAALFARTALEAVVTTRLSAAGLHVSGAKMRVKLICFRTCAPVIDANNAETAWAGLSRSCHHHAYELTPTWHEVDHLVGLVRRLGSG